jgi:hypothetical protein
VVNEGTNRPTVGYMWGQLPSGGGERRQRKEGAVLGACRAQPTTRRPTFDIFAHPCKSIHAHHLQRSLIAEPTPKDVAMASGRDVRDMLGLPMGGDGPKSAVQKRAKAAAPVRRIRTSGAPPRLRRVL